MNPLENRNERPNSRETCSSASSLAAKQSGRRSYSNPHIHPRRLARAVAKTNMRRAGWTKVNKHMALNWRNMALQNRR